MPTSTLSAQDAILAGGALGALAGAMASLAIVGLIIYVLVIVAQWKIFTKAGEKGWKSLIPIYNFYIMFKLFWETKWFWIYFGACLIAGIVSSLSQQGDTSVAALILMLLSLAAAIFGLVVLIMLYNRMSKSFGHGVGFTVGLVLLPNIFLLILGFNKDKYKKIAD